LGAETPVQRIGELLAAALTHRELIHRGVEPVIRNIFDDAEARPAVGTADERI
jgi:hypothetical protein